jgi:hypothetical protein
MATPTQEEITLVIEVYNRGTKDSDFADSIKMEPVLISGTRYKYNLCETNAYAEVESNG